MRSLKSIQKEIESLGEVDLFRTSKEVSHLPEILQDDENIKYLTSGMMDGTTWLIVCTQKRIILVDYGMFFGVKLSEMALENVNSVSYQTGLIFGSIEIWHGGARMLIENCEKQTVKPFCDAVNAAIKEIKSPAQNQSQNQQVQTQNQKPAENKKSYSTEDFISQLERLAALKEKGILTDEEFAEQKARILGTQK